LIFFVWCFKITDEWFYFLLLPPIHFRLNGLIGLLSGVRQGPLCSLLDSVLRSVCQQAVKALNISLLLLFLLHFIYSTVIVLTYNYYCTFYMYFVCCLCNKWMDNTLKQESLSVAWFL